VDDIAPAAGEPREIGWAVGPDVRLDYLDDPVSKNGYVVASGPAARVAELVAVVDEELMPFDDRALLQSIDSARDALNRARAVIRAGLGAPEDFDERFFNHIRDAMTDSQDWIREAAVWATAYSPWPQYRPLLEQTARNDSSEKIRTDAKAVLAGYDAQRPAL
jgi:hypothetical protein